MINLSECQGYVTGPSGICWLNEVKRTNTWLACQHWWSYLEGHSRLSVK